MIMRITDYVAVFSFKDQLLFDWCFIAIFSLWWLISLPYSLVRYYAILPAYTWEPRRLCLLSNRKKYASNKCFVNRKVGECGWKIEEYVSDNVLLIIDKK